MALNWQEYNQAFERELSRLNPAQRQAVEQIEGPVLVIAGPGTGKTQILAARIGQILRQTDALPNNILCLTFTDAGAQAMRKRLLSLIGPEAHRTPIFTFHSFCHAVVQDNLALFGRRELQPLSDLERVDIIRRLLEDLDGSHPLRRGQADPYLYEAQLADLFQRMKAENWSVAYVQECIDAFLADLPNRPEYVYQINRGPNRVGDPKTAQIEKAHERMERLRAAAALLPAYEARLREWARYDYNDMIGWVLKAFEDNELLLRNYQEQYLYVLTDEYQDTNGAQNEILRLLASYWDSPNLFIVGDDDQSIYEFQGARLRNIVDFFERYDHSLTTVVLTENYRSAQPILDAARSLIGYNEKRIGRQLEGLNIDKLLTARRPEARPMAPVVAEYPNRFQEEVALILELEARHAGGVAWSEMAVIFAQHRQAGRLQRLLDQRGIPYQTKRRVNALDTIMAQQLRDLLAYLQAEATHPHRGEPLLFRLLHFRCFELPPADLARLALAYARQSPAERPSWREWLREREHWPPGLEQPDRLAAVAAWIEETIGLTYDLPLPRLVERAINGSGLLRMAMAASDRIWQVQLLKTLLDFARQEAERRPRLSLEQWLESLALMDANRLILPVQSEGELTDAVQLTTAHSAKGLEFDSVFLLDVTTEFWDPGSGARNRQFPMPDTLTWSGEEDATEARRRLFYVAMTRAKSYLYLSYARATEQDKPLQRSQFADELLASGELSVTPASAPADERWVQQLAQLTEPVAPAAPVLEPQAVSRLLEGFRLSISAFNRYLYCPLGFFYESVLQAPQMQSEAATYGIAMHHALQWCFEQLAASAERRLPGLSEVVYQFELAMQRSRSFFTERGFAQKMEEGRRHLAGYYRQHSPHWPRTARTEVRMRHVEVEGVPIHGVIDRIDWLDGDTLRVTDYKTGSHNDRKMARPTPANPQGGAYWRQLVFYKLLAEGSRPASGVRVASGVISYLDPDRQGRYPERALAFEPEDTLQLKALLKHTYSRIMEQDFYTGCGRQECPWCRFVRQGQAPTSFSSEAIEQLDDE